MSTPREVALEARERAVAQRTDALAARALALDQRERRIKAAHEARAARQAHEDLVAAAALKAKLAAPDPPPAEAKRARPDDDELYKAAAATLEEARRAKKELLDFKCASTMSSIDVYNEALRVLEAEHTQKLAELKRRFHQT
jgi:hypothetical protein